MDCSHLCITRRYVSGRFIARRDAARSQKMGIGLNQHRRWNMPTISRSPSERERCHADKNQWQTPLRDGRSSK
jgi:hypothetical protein